jgi:hypothetical protein
LPSWTTSSEPMIWKKKGLDRDVPGVARGAGEG